MPGRNSFHEARTRILTTPLNLMGPTCIGASFRGAYDFVPEEVALPGVGLRPSGTDSPNSIALVLECPDYVDFQPVEATILSPDPRWKYAFAAKTRLGYRCLWLSEVSLAQAIAGIQVVA